MIWRFFDRHEFRVVGHVGGATNFVLMTGDQDAVPRHHQVRLDIVSALIDGQLIALERMFRTLPARTPMRNDNHLRQAIPRQKRG